MVDYANMVFFRAINIIVCAIIRDLYAIQYKVYAILAI
jgi:hypothetical protein